VAETKRTTKRASAGTTTPAGEPAEASREPAEPSREPAVCPVAFCPICGAVSAMNRAGPDVVQHLLAAGQQFLLALQAALDARASDFRDDDGGGDADAPRMHRIDVG
jgi:hypothetical protein